MRRLRISKFCLILSGIAIAVLVFANAPKIIWAAQDKEKNKEGEEKQQEIVSSINDDIAGKQKEIEELEGKIAQYRRNIAAKQKEESSIANEISLIDDRISKKQSEIEVEQAMLDKLVLEIQELNAQIEQKEIDIEDAKNNLGVILKKIYQYDQKTLLEVTLANPALSDYLVQVKYLENVDQGTKQGLDTIRSLKSSLEAKHEAVSQKKEDVEATKLSLEGERADLEGEKGFKDQILIETQLDEAKFQSLVSQVQKEKAQVDGEISSLEKEVRRRLDGENEDINDQELLAGEILLSWPVSSAGGISCEFHCADYPFKKYFEHSGIDIRISQGTPVKAAASGVIAIAKGGSGYSYILIVHGDRVSTVYGHLSSLSVGVDDLVQRGQVIGNSGGLPGTPGAGYYSTGPHLHFEVRLDGIPVNPRIYLP